MRAGRWLAARELRANVRRSGTAVALVAAAVALGTGPELLARAREEAVASRVDAIGPALLVVPRPVGRSALARLDLGVEALPDGVAEQVASILGQDLREARGRLVLAGDVGGVRAPIVGAGMGPEGEVALGPALAARLGSPSAVRLGGAEVRVSAVRAALGNAEDLAAFVPLAAARRIARRAGVNELQLFLHAGASPGDVASRLERAALPASVVVAGRGATADEELQAALARARRLAQAALAVMVGLGLAVAAHLDAAERRGEAATLVALGAARRTVAVALLLRSLWLALAGGISGAALGAALAWGSAAGAAPTLGRALPVLCAVMSLAAAVGLLAAAPSAVALALRDPVAVLQEG